MSRKGFAELEDIWNLMPSIEMPIFTNDPVSASVPGELFCFNNIPIQNPAVKRVINSGEKFQCGFIPEMKCFWAATTSQLMIISLDGHYSNMQIPAAVTTVFQYEKYIIVAHERSLSIFIHNKYKLIRLSSVNYILPPNVSITFGYKNYVGCNDGRIRKFQLSGTNDSATFVINDNFTTSNEDPINLIVQSDSILYGLTSNSYIYSYYNEGSSLKSSVLKANLTGIVGIFPCNKKSTIAVKRNGNFYILTTVKSSKVACINEPGDLITEDTHSTKKSYIISYIDQEYQITRFERVDTTIVAILSPNNSNIKPLNLSINDSKSAIIAVHENEWPLLPKYNINSCLLPITRKSSNKHCEQIIIGAKSDIEGKTLIAVSQHSIFNKSLKDLFGFENSRKAVWSKSGLLGIVESSSRPSYDHIIISRLGYRPIACKSMSLGLIYSIDQISDGIVVFSNAGITKIVTNIEKAEPMWKLIDYLKSHWNDEYNGQLDNLLESDDPEVKSIKDQIFKLKSSIGKYPQYPDLAKAYNGRKISELFDPKWNQEMYKKIEIIKNQIKAQKEKEKEEEIAIIPVPRIQRQISPQNQPPQTKIEQTNEKPKEEEADVVAGTSVTMINTDLYYDAAELIDRAIKSNDFTEIEVLVYKEELIPKARVMLSYINEIMMTRYSSFENLDQQYDVLLSIRKFLYDQAQSTPIYE